nr:unnamed protein product [Callosobruchus analis]
MTNYMTLYLAGGATAAAILGTLIYYKWRNEVIPWTWEEAETENEFRTARNYPKMVLIEVAAHDADHASLDAPTMNAVCESTSAKALQGS